NQRLQLDEISSTILQVIHRVACIFRSGNRDRTREARLRPIQHRAGSKDPWTNHPSSLNFVAPILHNEIEAGRMIGPRILTSGPMLDGPKPRFPSSIAIATPEDARHAVNHLKDRGADFIKLQSLI